VSPSVGVSLQQGSHIGEARCGREAVAPHQALERGTIDPERLGSPAHVSGVRREGHARSTCCSPKESIASVLREPESLPFRPFGTAPRRRTDMPDCIATAVAVALDVV
jgi:hypothetical protein